FEKFVEQHRVDLLIANGFGQSFWIATYQVWMHFGHFLRNQSKGNRLRSIILLVVAKADWLKLIDRFAGCVHGANVMFVSPRRDVGAAESPVAVYRDRVWVYSNLRLNIGVNLANKTAVAHVLTICANRNNVISGGDILTGGSTYSNIV